MCPRPRTCEANVLVFYSLHVESDGGDGCHHLSELELVQDGRLTSCVQTHLHSKVKLVPRKKNKLQLGIKYDKKASVEPH